MARLDAGFALTPDRVAFLTSGPVLRTLGGCRRRIATLGLAERWALSYAFGESDLDALARVLWHHARSQEAVRRHHGKEKDRR